MSFACLVEEDGHTRRFGATDFPLAVGGPGADIVVPGLARDEVAAFLALDDGELFAQPQPGPRLLLGGQPVTVSQWLHDGDEIRLLDTRIRIAWRDGRRALQVRHQAAGAAAPLPALAAPARSSTSKGEILVRPAEYRPRALALQAPPRRFPRPSLRIVAASLAVLFCAGFLFAARLVEVRVEPQPERLSVRGWPHVPWGQTRLLLPGRYTVRAGRAGYRPLDQTLVVTGERRQVARFELQRLPGSLVLDVAPARGVRVFVDGQERGRTPLPPVLIAAGPHEVSLRAEGYQAFTTRVTMAGGGEEQTLRARLVEDRAPVAFSSEPSGATVRVDGAEVGRTPLRTDLTSGRRTVTAALAGHRSASRTIEVMAGRPLTVPSFRLDPLPGRLRVQSEPPGAAVSVDGQFRGETPVEITVAPGTDHAVRLSKAGHDAAEAKVRLDLDEQRTLTLALVPQLGEVEVTAEPADAEVLVDGEPRGRAGQTLRLTAVAHQIEVRRSGYEPHRVTLTPRPGFPQTVKARLRSLGEPAPAVARPARLTARGHELRLLSPGRFQMGASRREPGRRANETLREVELQRPAYVSVTEVTNAQFRRFQPAHSSGTLGSHRLGADTQPVVQVTWEQAAEYCNWLSAQEGLPPVYASRGGKLVAAQPLGAGFRLPTEAEWTRAARYADGGPLKYPWGAALPAPSRTGNYADESARAVVAAVLHGYDDGYPVSSPVASFRPNALGFYDLGGNVAEWVHDVYSIPPADTPLQRDPAGPPEGELHVIMGSSYLHGTVTELRLSYRDYATKARPDVGFRVARYAQ